ncbi:MAG: hypothetical protein ACC657_07620 [Thiohalomonadales bacterium]
MKLNVNLNWISSWDGTVQFANCLKQSKAWTRESGTASFTDFRGLLTTSDTTSQFRMIISDRGRGFPTGTYTVLNPAGANLAIGRFNEPQSSAYTTATQFTFDYTANKGLLALWCKGGTSTGLAVIIPNHLDSYQAGDFWNTEFISFISAMNMTGFRAMNWTFASQNLEVNWADRALPDDITFNSVDFTDKKCMPWEYVFDFANKMLLNPWVCIPHRASDSYIDSFAQLALTNLNTNLKIYTELGNEIWNSGNPWGDGRGWLRDLKFTKKTAIANSNNTYTLMGHGLLDNSKIGCFTSIENRVADSSPSWRITNGRVAYIKVIDSNTFQVIQSVDGEIVAVAENQVNLLFSDLAGLPIKGDDVHINYGLRSVEIWDILENRLPMSQVVKIIASQFSNPQNPSSWVTKKRFEAAGVSGRADYVSVAPYFKGGWWGTQVILSSGSVLPTVWINRSGSTVYAACYLAGATPTNAAIKSGSGSVAIGIITGTGTSKSYDSFPAMNVVNGTSYDMHFIFVDRNGADNNIVVPFTAALSGTIDGVESFADTVARIKSEMTLFPAMLNNHSTAASGIPMIAYEGGMHFHEKPPIAIDDWRTNFLHSSEFTNLTNHYYTLIAPFMEEFFHYKDISSASWGYANTYSDTNDPRYVARLLLGGSVLVKEEKLLAIS